MLVVGCDLVLGPLLSLVIYNGRKSRRQLLVDYGIVGAIQIGALVYGVLIVADVRPVWVAYYTDRYEIVLAGDLKKKELDAVKDPQYAKVGWSGPKYVGVSVPPMDQQDALSQSLEGNEEHQRPKFYVPYESVIDRIRKSGKPLAELEKKFPASKPLIEAALKDVKVPREKLVWLPAHSFLAFWTVIVDIDTGKPQAWVDFDPYGPD
jgi:hypothetical protein